MLFLIVIRIDFHYFFYVHSHLNTGKGSKKPAYKKAVETGTANDDVDYEWIPRSALRTPGNWIGYATNVTKDIIKTSNIVSASQNMYFVFYRKQ